MPQIIPNKILGSWIERANFATYGILPRCRRCDEKCAQYNAKGLMRLVCKKSLEFKAVAERMEFVENVVKPGIERMMK
jgi:hypothetical protein